MNPNSKKFNFKNFSNHNPDISPQNQRDKLRSKLMVKYNLNYDDAEKVLLRLVKENNIVNSNTEISNNTNLNKINNNQSHNFNYPPKNQIKSDFIHENSNNNLKSNSFGDSQDKMSTENQSINMKEYSNNQKQDSIKNRENLNIYDDSQEVQHLENVDSLLQDLIPDYNKQISISVDNVDLSFEVEIEKVDTLKEMFIRTIKRDKSKKIKIHALRDISFKIYKGEKVGIIGYNGAGKSTLLNVITGIYLPDKGKVTTIGNISPLLSLGAGFDYNFSGRKNIIFNGAVLGYDKEFLESKVDEIIEFSELGEFIDIPIKNYSQGMLAKLGFSIATAVEPDILIIDEILGVGDLNFQKKSLDKMKGLMNGGATVVLVSHSIPQIRELCDKAIWIDNGNLREMGEVNKVCDHYIKDAEKASNEQLANIQIR